MLSSQPNMNALWSHLMVEELVRQGVTHFVVSPGSRSTPLAYAVAQHPQAVATAHIDERGAAFHALGIGKATGMPAVFICTSGTAVANALPAVVEADAAQVPLIILTADRPPELLDTGANQAIRQPGIFANYVRWETTLPCPDPAIPLPFVLTSIDQAAHRAVAAPAGPAHVNCMFREPLAPEPDGTNRDGLIESIGAWVNSEEPYTRYSCADAVLSASDSILLRDSLAGAKRGVIVIGQLMSQDDRDAATAVCECLGWPVLADIASGLRLANLPGSIPYYDAMLGADTGAALGTLDAVLHLGGAVTSKALLSLFADCAPRPYVRVANHAWRHDPNHRITWRLTCSLTALSAAVSNVGGSADMEWVASIQGASRALGGVLDDALNSDLLTEPGIARHLSRIVPDTHALFLGNSMPIRDWDRYAATPETAPTVMASRGTSGIDGNIATAAGVARGTGTAVTAVLGDLTTLHDLNSLALLRDPSIQVMVIVINNDGGGIFSFLPMAKHTEHFEKFWGTPHGMGFAELAQGFGVRYANPESISELEHCYTTMVTEGGSAVIEVRTDRHENQVFQQNMAVRLRALPQ
jgi:2-succinyl-5-enolpyruvyl-6-hydroxy-3-cyclohexene-1-carboxylate synthase